jgi:hypothetical protein
MPPNPAAVCGDRPPTTPESSGVESSPSPGANSDITFGLSHPDFEHRHKDYETFSNESTFDIVILSWYF